MAKAYEAKIAADGRAFDQGIRSGVIKPLDEAVRATGRLEDAVGDVGRDGARGVERLEDAIRGAQRETRDFERATRGVGDEADRSLGRVKRGFDEAGGEAAQSAREGAASFTGEFGDAADFVQETLANALGGFGPLGAAAGLAAALGLGVAVAKVDELTQKVEDLQQLAAEIQLEALENDQTVEEFTTGVEGASAALQRLQEEGQKRFRWWWDEDQTGLQEFNDDLRRAGETEADSLDIFQLSTAQMGKYRDAVRDNTRELRDRVKVIEESARGMGTLSDADLVRMTNLRKQAEAGDRVIETLEREIETRAEAGERADAWADSGAQAAAERAEAEQAAADARATAEEEAAARIQAATSTVVQEQLSGYDRMRSAAYEKSTADDAAFDVDKWLTYVEETRAAADGYRANLQTMQLTPAEWENLLALPEDARAAIAASYASAGDDGKARIRAALGDGGAGDAGNEATVSFDKNFDPNADVEVKVDTTRAEQDLTTFAATEKTLTVKVKLDKTEIDNWKAPTLRVNIQPDWQRQLLGP